MWQDLPREVQGEIFGWCRVSEWYRYTKTHRAGMNTFPSSAITYMSLDTESDAKLRSMLGEVAVDFDLRQLEFICMSYTPSVMRSYVGRAFLKACPRARLVFDTWIPLEDFLKYARGLMDPVMTEWLDRVDSYGISLQDNEGTPQSELPLCSSRLLNRPFDMDMFSKNGKMVLMQIWHELFHRAARIRFNIHPSRHPILIKFVERPLPLISFRNAKGRDGVVPWKFTGPMLSRRVPFERLDPRHVQSHFILIDDEQGIQQFLNHRDHFDRHAIRPCIFPRTMARLSADVWVVALSHSLFLASSLFDFIHLFLFYFDHEWCTDMPTLRGIASRLVDCCIAFQVSIPNKDIISQSSYRRHPGIKMDCILESVLYWVNAFSEETCVGAYARRLWNYLKEYQKGPDSFLEEMNMPQNEDWTALSMIDSALSPQ